MSFIAFNSARAVTKSRRNILDKNLLLSAATIALIASPAAYANPTGGAVTTGSASISTASNKTSVNQKSEDVVIDWSSFNVGNGQTMQFVQPNAQAIAVNRIGGASASQILGTLDANGRVVLINGNGVLFGKGAQVNVGSLIATSTDGSDSDVLAGKFTQAGKQNASVVNTGTINAASGGMVALVAPNVTNAGTVNAKLGTVALGAANKFTVDFTGDGLVSFAAQGDVNARASAINSGLLSGANVSMTAHAANGIATGIVNMSGIITAQGVQNIGGTIYLNAGNGALTSTGTLNAAGATGGGRIETSGETANISGHITAGQGGQWTVDPINLTVNAAAAGVIDTSLNAGTSVLLNTTSSTAHGPGLQTSGAGDIDIESAISWNTAATLRIDAYHSIAIDAPITIAGAGTLYLQYNDEATDGALAFSANFGGTGRAAFTDVVGGNTQGSLTIQGTSYTLVNSIAQLASAVSANSSGNYALADNYDATPDGTYSSNPIVEVDGTLEGLGNTISNFSFSGYFAALIAFVSSGATIADLNLANVDIVDPGGLSEGEEIGGLVGGNVGTIRDSTVTGTLSVTSAGTRGSGSGLLVGFNTGTITDDFASGTVTGTEGTGLLVGINEGTISFSHSAGLSTGATVSMEIGGLVGQNNTGLIRDSYSTASVVGTGSAFAGGLVGENGIGGANVGTIADSYATGAVSSPIDAGGLVGVNFEGTIENSFATGAVTGTASGSAAGGLVGELFDSTITGSYSTGAVTGVSGASIGGLIGNDGGGTNTNSSSYWDLGTSGITNTSQGVGNVANDPGITGETTAALQSALPSGFGSSDWSIVPGTSYPYLNWQFNGTPQVISGIAYTDAGVTADAGDTVSALLNGNALDSALTNGSVVAGANGYYYFLLAPGTLSGAGSQVLATSSVGAALAENANGATTNLNIDGNTLSDVTSTASYATVQNNLAAAIGSDSSAASFVAGLGNVDITSSAASFALDAAADLSTSNLEIKTINGDIDVTAAQGWASTETMALDSHHSIAFNAPVTISGDGGLVLTTNDGIKGGSGGLTFSAITGGTGHVAFTDVIGGNTQGVLVINGTVYTLANSVAQLASDISGNTSGNYALANSYDASADGVYSTSPIATLGGTLEGLGNPISNFSYSGNNAGLVANVGSGGTIADLGLTNVDIADAGGLGAAEAIAGLVAVNSGTIRNSYVTGTLSVATPGSNSSAGLLVGENDGTVTGGFANGSVTGGDNTGVLVGIDTGTIIYSHSAGSADSDVLEAQVGGLVGSAESGTVENSFSEALATSGSVNNSVGGLIGFNDGSIVDSYATGAASGTFVGGLVGDDGGPIATSFATGIVSGRSGGAAGGLVGTGSGTYSNSYWDLGASGITNPSQGVGDTSNRPGITGDTTAQLQAALPSGFSSSSWSIMPGVSYPYLNWQFSGTPQVVSGFVVAANGKSNIAGVGVGLLVNGSVVTPAVDMNSGADGYYYLLVAPDTISNSGSNVLTYLTGSTPSDSYAYAKSSVQGLELREDWLFARSNASDSNAIFTGIDAALGGASGAQFLYTAGGGFAPGASFEIHDSAAAFSLDSSIDVGDNVLVLNTNGGDTQTAGTITAATLGGASGGSAAFDDAGNEIGTLGGFTGTGGISLTDSETLRVAGLLDAGTGDLSLTTTNGGNIALDNDLTAGGTITLDSAGTIWQNTASSVISAGTLTGSSNGVTRLQGANLITDLGSFTNTGGNFQLTNAQTLTVTGTVNAGTKTLSLQTTGGDLIVNGALDADVVSLSSSLGGVSGTGAITAAALDVSADTGIDLSGSNDITHVKTDTTNSGPNIVDNTH